MRVYIPGTVSELALQTSGQWEPEHGFAVTELLKDAQPELDEDELVEFAIDTAADASALERGSSLRVVLVADFSRADVAADMAEAPAGVRIAGRLSPSAIACVFIDEDDALEDIDAARAGDGSALERMRERSLLWYDLGELEYLNGR